MTDITQEQLNGNDSSGFKAADYNHVANVATLQSVRLLHLKTDIRPELGLAGAALSYGRTLLSCDHDGETDAAAAIFRFHVTAKAKRKKVFYVEADFMATYDVGEGAQGNAARAFVNNVGLFAAYPYFRALVSQVSWNAGLHLPPMPSIASTAYKSALATPNSDD